MAALSELILQMVMCLHVGSHAKPQRVKMHIQTRAGRKGHKKNKRRFVSDDFFSLLLRQSFALDEN